MKENQHTTPRVSVILPVHNAGLYVKEALESILNQTFRDFELIVINDGSSDESEEIIRSYSDARIRLIHHETAQGVSRSMNEAFELCKGEFIARMDADDISLPERLKKQVLFLDEHPNVAVVFGRIQQIDVYGNPFGSWKDDLTATSYEEIMAILPYRNCLANPSFMMRREIASAFKLEVDFIVAEDYVYWLNLASRGYRLEKIPEVLVKYRIHPSSVTVASNKKNPLKRYLGFQWNYAKSIVRRGPYNFFHLRFLLGFFLNLILYPWKAWVKPAMRMVLKIWRAKPWSLVLQLYRLKRELKNTREGAHQAFFFFPFYHIGGAERVHADIVECASTLKPIVFITKTSENTGFLDRFEKNARCFDVGELCWYPWFKQRTYRIITEFINSTEKPIVFGSNSIAMYEMIPLLKSHVTITDLIHAFVHPEESGPEKWSLPSVHRIHQRVLISRKTLNEMLEFYTVLKLDVSLKDRLLFIRNFTSIPEEVVLKRQLDQPLRIVYVGRGSPEKRISLMGAIANRIHQKGLTAKFVFIGKDLEISMNPKWREDCIFTGEITDDTMLSSEWKKADLLLMTSSREGFPMVIMEAMAHGVIPVVTSVGDIPNVITHGENGFLLPIQSEEAIVDEAVEIILNLNSDREKIREISTSTYTYARSEFSREKFERSYQKLFHL